MRARRETGRRLSIFHSRTAVALLVQVKSVLAGWNPREVDFERQSLVRLLDDNRA